MTGPEALRYLASLEPQTIRPGLDRIAALLARLGDPQQAFPSVLVAGTNGKGSVVAFLASILRSAGLLPGVYTSPHLARFAERIVVGREPIPAGQVAGLTAEVRAAIAEETRGRGGRPTYFEATTALAFLHFARTGVPIALLEVGMGGRYDATNVVEPLLCAITPVALDHTQWLGRTLGAIARQKAGIMRPGVPCVLGRQEPEALAVLEREAERLGTPLVRTADCVIRPAAGPDGRPPDPPVFSLTTPHGVSFPDLRPSLRGAHQADNAAVAVLLAERLRAAGFGVVDDAAIADGLAATSWPGRLELAEGRPAVLLDGAHNPAGCQSLAAWLADHAGGRRVVLVFSAMRDKPAGEMLDRLAPHAGAIVVVRLRSARGEGIDALHALAAARTPRAVRAASVGDALRLARAAAGPDGLVVVSGSLYLVGAVKEILAAEGRPESRKPRPAPAARAGA
jgi:dihydrofolate synthase/folylpolyglutamate synthase